MGDHDHEGHHGHDHSDADPGHGDHTHAGHDHEHEHSHHEHEQAHDEALPDVSGWLASTQKLSCPACGAGGALTLGGGIFCPSCGEVTTNAGYQAPAPAPEPESGPQ